MDFGARIVGRWFSSIEIRRIVSGYVMVRGLAAAPKRPNTFVPTVSFGRCRHDVRSTR